MLTKILIVEDERGIRDMIGYALSRAGISYAQATTSDEASRLIEQTHFDLVLLDWMLPDVSGIDLARRLREDSRTASLPIIMLTARGEEEDKVRGLDVGADDFVTKPFSPKELVARIRAVLRRAGGQTVDIIEAGGLILNTVSHRVHARGNEVQLSQKEFQLLQVLMSNPDRVFSRAQLLDLVWPRAINVGERTVDVHVSTLRKALEPFGGDHRVETVRGAGYRFSPHG
ncbi:MAG: phosphate regulon transcriptional regulator PhoB [Geminicoccaceae bacterium]